jgi:hypothetical protein
MTRDIDRVENAPENNEIKQVLAFRLIYSSFSRQ